MISVAVAGLNVSQSPDRCPWHPSPVNLSIDFDELCTHPAFGWGPFDMKGAQRLTSEPTSCAYVHVKACGEGQPRTTTAKAKKKRRKEKWKLHWENTFGDAFGDANEKNQFSLHAPHSTGLASTWASKAEQGGVAIAR
jgi:hypothetical protein